MNALPAVTVLLLGVMLWAGSAAGAEGAGSQADGGAAAGPDSNTRDLMRKAVSVRPHPRQAAWQELEFLAFVHFGVNTFTGREWGTGKESPEIFNPVKLDAEQWARTCKAAGMKMILLTAKHHDGFCLWPSAYTEHDVENSPWKGGRGDVVREVADACRKYGLKLGVYLSPADLAEIRKPGGRYGNGSKATESAIPTPVPGRVKATETRTYVVDDYNRYFLNQLWELLTQYGPVHAVWFDGANPKPGTGQTYDRKAWFDLIRTLQPDACIAIKGPDVRWCGNEAGRTRKAEWSVIPIGTRPGDWTWPDARANDLGSLARLRRALEREGHLHWYPAETNTSIRHGWFWRDEKQRVKTPQEILDIWHRSVGGNTVFLLNIPPNRDGLFSERDTKVLLAVGEFLRKMQATDLAAGAEAGASAVRGKGFEARNILDGDPATCWMPPDWTVQSEVAITLDGVKTFNRVVLQEQIGEYGQRIAGFAVDAYLDGRWKEIARDTVVGYKRICTTPAVTTNQVRIRILDSRVCPTLSRAALHYAPVRLSTPRFLRSKGGDVTISCTPSGPKIHYTLDGSAPAKDSPVFEKPIPLPRGGTVRAVAVDPRTGQAGDLAIAEFDICRAKWKLVRVSSKMPRNKNSGAHAIDDNPRTYWSSRQERTGTATYPHEIVVDLGEVLELKGFTYLPRQEQRGVDVIAQYALYVSSDGASWGEPAAKGAFANIANNPVRQSVRLDGARRGRFIRFVALAGVSAKQKVAAIAELGVITRE